MVASIPSLEQFFLYPVLPSHNLPPAFSSQMVGDELSEVQLGLLCWSLVALGMSPGKAWMDAACAASERMMGRVEEQRRRRKRHTPPLAPLHQTNGIVHTSDCQEHPVFSGSPVNGGVTDAPMATARSHKSDPPQDAHLVKVQGVTHDLLCCTI